MGERAESTEVSEGFWDDADDATALQWYRTLVNTIDDGLYQLDPDGRFVAVNDVILETTGYSRDELLGAHASTLLAADDCERIERAIRERRTTGATTVGSFELEIETADGERVPIELRVSCLVDDGTVRGTVGVARDISDRKQRQRRAETALESYESLTNVLDEADVGVFVLDDQFDVAWVDATAETYFGIDRDAAIGRDKRELVEETIQHRVADSDAFRDAVLATYDDNTDVEHFDCHVTAGADREERWLEHRSKPIESGRYAGGRVELYYDVTEQYRYARQLRRLNDAVTEWLAESSFEGAADRASTHLREILNMELNGIYRYDSARDVLAPAGWTDATDAVLEDLPTFAPGEGIAWRVFESGEPEIFDDVRTAPDVYDPDTPIRSEIVLPIGDHGVVVIGSEEREAFDDDDLMLAKVATSSLEATFDRLRHERRLERERDLTDRILDATPVGTLVLDADGAVTRINERAAEVFDVAEPDVFSPTDRVLYDESGDRLPTDERPYARALETGEPVYDRVVGIDRPTGDRRWLSINAVPLTDGGAIDRVVTTGEDVTALKEREQELETELREVFGRVSDAFYAVDEAYRFTHLNDRAAELLGVDERAVRGKRIGEVFPETDEIDRIRSTFETAMETQEPTDLEHYSELLGVWIEATIYPSESGVSVYFRDVSERKERERDLELFRTLIDHSTDGVYVIDPETGRILDVNHTACRRHGYDRETLLELTVPDIEAELSGRDGWQSLVEEVRTTDRTTFEGHHRRADGSTYPVEVNAAHVELDSDLDPHRDREYVLAIVRDVTERREYQRKLEASNERLEQFAYAVSHDLQEPLRMISSYLSLLEDRYGDALGADGREFVDYAVDGAERMQAMIEGLLEYSRVETRGEPFEPIELDAVLEDVLADLQFKLEESDAEVTVESLPAVEGDASQLRQVFQNLLDNAIEYSGDDPPRVRITAERTGDEWTVSVSDEGIGIDPDDADRIFEIFQRLHTHDEHAGTGIGLALCERIVERHGGELWVDSEPGAGATFSFTLPAADGE